MHNATAIALYTLTAFDGVLLLIVLISTLLAFGRGIVRVLFSLAGLVIGLLLAVWNYAAVADYLEQYVLNYLACEILGFAGILIAVIMCFGLCSGIVYKAVNTVGLGAIDRVLGAIFGLFRGILVGVALMIAGAVFVPDSPWLRHSQLAPYFLAASHAVSFVVPADFAQKIQKGAAHLLEQAPEKIKFPPLSVEPR